MRTTLVLSALSGFVPRSIAQSADFTGMTFGNVTVGQLWPIYWSAGNGYTVSLAVSNGSFSSSIFTNIPATPGNYNWTVTVSPDFTAGYYSLALSQTGAGTATSPTFYVSFGDDVPPPPTNNTGSGPTVTSTTSIAPSSSTTNTSLPTVTVVWYEEGCGCTKTTTCDTIALPTATNGSLAPTTWYEEQCGCSKTAFPAAPTVAPAVNNYTIPSPTPAAQPNAQASAAATSPVTPVASTYKGAAVKVSSAGFGVLALLAATFAS